MATLNIYRGALGAETVLATNTNLSALANNARFLSASYNNVQGGGGGGGSIKGMLTFTCTMAVAATANTGFDIYILKSQDGGATYERGGTGYTPALTALVGTFVAPTDTTQSPMMMIVDLPPGLFEVLIVNNGTGQALKTDTGATGSKLTLTPYTDQIV